MLQCAAVCCSVVAVRFSMLHYVTVCCSVLQCVAVCCSVCTMLQCVAVCLKRLTDPRAKNELQYVPPNAANAPMPNCLSKFKLSKNTQDTVILRTHEMTNFWRPSKLGAAILVAPNLQGLQILWGETVFFSFDTCHC